MYTYIFKISTRFIYNRGNTSFRLSEHDQIPSEVTYPFIRWSINIQRLFEFLILIYIYIHRLLSVVYTKHVCLLNILKSQSITLFKILNDKLIISIVKCQANRNNQQITSQYSQHLPIYIIYSLYYKSVID